MSKYEGLLKHVSVITDSDEDCPPDDEVHDPEEFQRLLNALKVRFTGAQFVISCFGSVDEIETKILTDEETILYCDRYQSRYLNDEHEWCEFEDYQDFFILHNKKDQSYIRHCDVIDAMIANNFERNKCTHKFLERILKCYDRRNTSSIPTYCFSWGS